MRPRSSSSSGPTISACINLLLSPSPATGQRPAPSDWDCQASWRSKDAERHPRQLYRGAGVEGLNAAGMQLLLCICTLYVCTTCAPRLLRRGDRNHASLFGSDWPGPGQACGWSSRGRPGPAHVPLRVERYLVVLDVTGRWTGRNLSPARPRTQMRTLRQQPAESTSASSQQRSHSPVSSSQQQSLHCLPTAGLFWVQVSLSGTVKLGRACPARD